MKQRRERAPRARVPSDVLMVVGDRQSHNELIDISASGILLRPAIATTTLPSEVQLLIRLPATSGSVRSRRLCARAVVVRQDGRGTALRFCGLSEAQRNDLQQYVTRWNARQSRRGQRRERQGSPNLQRLFRAAVEELDQPPHWLRKTRPALEPR
jgi:c-di-GMP-binding flagellar brake protein YcgR